ncbi:element excision factor XisH family protein [Roseofilum casamattae]|uniref:Element excision factor XisH family protein n=1 Tax=Roseofilum casamattae BLCC-M143 TaxID=3022442 RepID=A0ABT7BWW1_9CYAN|nr:element excision factor XisH family protein [Roseofilum casamattae]MDJ1183655.1 element excision factor XisH family protein [Roseofilum casamattae BLCC-M143]
MSAKDVYHNTVKVALQKEGWVITHDPLVLELSSGRLEIDLGAEQLVAAEKDSIQIAVEIKSFLLPSATSQFHQALGQFLNYRVALKVKDSNRILFLAVPAKVYRNFFSGELAQLSIAEYQVKLIVFDSEQEVIVEWKD